MTDESKKSTKQLNLRECSQTISLPSVDLALEFHGDQDKPLLICLHGWLDNLASFYLLVNQLKNDYQLLLVDLPGHGLSEPLADGAHYYIWQNIETLYELLQALEVERANLLGHSMGGVVASLFAGTFPDKVNTLVLLDSLGPMTSSAEQSPEQLAKAIIDAQKTPSQLRVFSDVKTALVARRKSSPASTEQALLPIVKRNLKPVEGGVSWRTDRRLRHTSKVRLTEEQVLAFLSKIKANVLVVLAKQGIVPKPWIKQRLAVLTHCELVEVEGHHHFHTEAAFIDGLLLPLKQFYSNLLDDKGPADG